MRHRFPFLVLSGAVALACNAVLGLEEVRPTRAGAAGGGGSSGKGGSAGGATGGTTGAGTAGSAGTAGGGAMSGSGGEGGEAGAASMDGGVGGEGGETGGMAGSGGGTSGTGGGMSGSGGGGGVVTDCEPGEYVEAEATAGSDRQCAPCPAGSYSAEMNAEMCLSCASGSFSEDPGSTECTEWTTCVRGTHVSADGSATSDRECADCPMGTQSTIENQSECLPPGACQPGTEEITPATQSDPAECDACEAGTFCPGGSTPKTDCATGTWDHDQSSGTACADWLQCQPGSSVSADGSAVMDRSCAACTSGTFSTTTNATSCTDCAECDPGTHVSTVCTTTTNRACTDCTSGYFSTATNAPSCTACTPCTAGTYVSTACDATTNRGCMACASGYFSTTTNAPSCTVCATCNAGTYVTGNCTASTNRGCTACVNGYSTMTNATNCTAWTACPMFFTEDAPGTPTTDRTCKEAGWTRQIGSSSDDHGYGVSADSSGNVYVSGYTPGALPGQTNLGSPDAFVQKYNSSGALQWTRQFGTNNGDFGYEVAVDTSGNVHVAGHTSGAFAGQTSSGSTDGFVVKYNGSGTLQWARQFSIGIYTYGESVSVDSNGNVFVGGYFDLFGSRGVFVQKFNSSGTAQWSQAPSIEANGGVVSADLSGNVYLSGRTAGTLPGETNAGGEDTFVAKYDSSGTLQWARQFGTSATDSGWAVTADSGGNVYVAGYTLGTFAGQTSAGSSDVFVVKYNSSGVLQWARQFGSSSSEAGYSVSVDSGGRVKVAGYTSGTLPGQTSAGGNDAFATELDASGALQWTRQFGTSSSETGWAVSVASSGAVYVAGDTSGTFPGQTSAGLGDAFVKQIVP